MSGVGRRWWTAAPAAALLAVLVTPAARADTTVIGSTTLPAQAAEMNGGQGVTAFQNVAGDTSYVVSAPVSGTITSWSFRNGTLITGPDPNNSFVLRVLAPTDVGPTQYAAVGTSPAQTVPDATDSVRGPFPISLPVAVGDRIALENTGSNGTVPVLAGVSGADSDTLTTNSIADGNSSPFTDGGVFPNNTQIPIQATITYTPSATNPPPTPTPSATTPAGRLASLAPPVAGKSVDIVPISGTVLIRLPGSSSFVALSSIGRQVPVGAELDVTRGTVRLTAARGIGTAQTKTSDFFGGGFRVTQPSGTSAVVDLTLTGPLGDCARPGARAARGAVAARRRAPRSRHLWGNGNGTFRTVGQRGAAAVRGTIWLVEDRWDGSTLVLVRRGVIAFQDFTLHRTIVVSAGHRYVARPARR